MHKKDFIWYARRQAVRTVVLLFVVCLSATAAAAATRVWDGGGADNKWTTAANWVGDVAPAADDSIVFPAVAAKYAVDYDVSIENQAYNSIAFEGGSYTINGGQPLKVAPGIVAVLAGTHRINTTITGQPTLRAEFGAEIIIVGQPSNFVAGAIFEGNGTHRLTVNNRVGNVVKRGSGVSYLTQGEFISIFRGSIKVEDGTLVADLTDMGSFGDAPADLMDEQRLEIDVTKGVLDGSISSPDSKIKIRGSEAVFRGVLFASNIEVTDGATYAPELCRSPVSFGGYILGYFTIMFNNAVLKPTLAANCAGGTNRIRTLVEKFFDENVFVNGIFNNLPEGGLINVSGTTFRVTYRGGGGNDVDLIRAPNANFDVDGDGRAGLVLFRPSDGIWYSLNSTIIGRNTPRPPGPNFIANFSATQFGNSNDVPVLGDYDGDGASDIAVWRPSNGTWYVLGSRIGFYAQQFGSPGDRPVPGDYDGDGRTDFAVFRPSQGVWYIFGTTAGFSALQFGNINDRVVPADFDGDGRTDIAVFRPSDNQWYVQQSRDGFRAQQWGNGGDRQVASDYDGDGRADFAVWRPAEGRWYVLRSTRGFVSSQFGSPGDTPVPADYDGDGITDIAVWRAGTWYYRSSRIFELDSGSSDGFFRAVQFGNSNDRPVSAALAP